MCHASTRPASSRSRGPARLAGLVTALALLAGAHAPAAKVFLTLDQALALVFGDPEAAERRTAYLTEDQAARISETAGSAVETKIVVYYEGAGADGTRVTAYFDTHMVRTLPETVMIVVGAGGTIVRVDVLSFDEPEDYLPSRRWLDQFNGKPLDDELSTRKAIRAVTGATISSRVITATVRRALAIHQILNEQDEARENAP